MKTMVRKRGRPSKESAANEVCAKDRLIDTALLLFYQFGIHSVGVDRIIAESQVAKMTFFKHFPTKRDLILEFLRVRDERYMQWFVGTLDSITTDKKKRLPACVDVVALWFQDPKFRGCAFINTTVEIGSGETAEKVLCVSHKKRLREFLETVADDAGIKKSKELSDILVTLIDGATVRAQMDGAEAGVKALREAALPILKIYNSRLPQ